MGRLGGEDVASILLAGGDSRRLGQDKALLLFRGRPLVRWMAERLQGAGLDALRPVIVTAPPERAGRLAALGLRVVADAYPGRGPLAGVHAGLAAAGEGYHFVIACDQPLFEPGAIRHLFEQAGTTTGGAALDAFVPHARGRLQVLHAVYHHRAAAQAAWLLESGETKMMALLSRIPWRPVPEEELRPFGDPGRMFFNLNAPGDLEALRRLEHEPPEPEAR